MFDWNKNHRLSDFFKIKWDSLANFESSERLRYQYYRKSPLPNIMSWVEMCLISAIYCTRNSAFAPNMLTSTRHVQQPFCRQVVGFNSCQIWLQRRVLLCFRCLKMSHLYLQRAQVFFHRGLHCELQSASFAVNVGSPACQEGEGEAAYLQSANSLRDAKPGL